MTFLRNCAKTDVTSRFFGILRSRYIYLELDAALILGCSPQPFLFLDLGSYLIEKHAIRQIVWTIFVNFSKFSPSPASFSTFFDLPGPVRIHSDALGKFWKLWNKIGPKHRFSVILVKFWSSWSKMQLKIHFRVKFCSRCTYPEVCATLIRIFGWSLNVLRFALSSDVVLKCQVRFWTITDVFDWIEISHTV